MQANKEAFKELQVELSKACEWLVDVRPLLVYITINYTIHTKRINYYALLKSTGFWQT
jgi:hypothetical protein